MLANGDTIDDLLEEYPSLTREDILAALDYWLRRRCKPRWSGNEWEGSL